VLTVKRPRARPIEALALVLILLLFAFAAGLHSMHNLGRLNQTTQCAVASASAHLACATVESVAIEKPAPLLEIVPRVLFSGPPVACLASVHGRAPPFFTA